MLGLRPFIYRCRCGCGTWYLLAGTLENPDRLACDTWQTAWDIAELILTK